MSFLFQRERQSNSSMGISKSLRNSSEDRCLWRKEQEGTGRNRFEQEGTVLNRMEQVGTGLNRKEQVTSGPDLYRSTTFTAKVRPGH